LVSIGHWFNSGSKDSERAINFSVFVFLFLCLIF
jgi:hypothetical protein